MEEKKEKEERNQLAIPLISLKTIKGMKFEGHRECLFV